MKVHRERFTELTTDRSGERVLNIIFVHGLRGHPRSTWEDTKHKGFGPKVFWPEQFLAPDLPRARIWTYGYNANVIGFFAAINKNSILQHGEDLAVRLEHDIDNKDPIVFIAHSLGGIIVKHAMHESKECRNRTKLIVFLGTPHRGSEYADWGRIATILMNIVLDSNKKLVDNLGVNSELLDNVHERFLRIIREDELKVHSFYEARGISGFKLFSGKVVDDTSSRINLPKPFETVESLDANHTQMARCISRNDPNYRAILHVLKRFIQMPTRRKLPDSDCANALSQSLEHVEILRQRHWVVSFGRNESFVGRESILYQLLKRIPPSANKDDCQRTAIEGLGGVGKTQLALEAAFRVRDEHPHCSVFWVPAVDMGSFENAYREIGRKLKIDRIDEGTIDVKKVVAAALGQEDAGMWLLVIDNADDTDFFFGHQRVVDYLPFSRMGSILFTTRNHEAVVSLDIPKPGIIRVAEMNGIEAFELLQNSLREDQLGSNECVTRLLEFLANLPLAIRQASAYMGKTGMSTKKYLEYCQASDEKLVKLLSKDFEDQARYKDSGNAVATTWLVSFKHISRDNAVAAHYLEFLCFFGEKDIPKSLLPPVDNELEAEKAIGTLKAYEFITQREERDSFDVHRLVRLAMQNWLNREGKKEERVTQVIERMANVCPVIDHANRDVCMSYLPHAQALLNVRGGSIQNKADVVLSWRVGTLLPEILKHREAERILRSGVGLGEKLLGTEHRLILNIKNQLALVLSYLERYEEAEQLYSSSLRIEKKTLGVDHKTTSRTMNNLALALERQCKYDEAEKLSRKALQLSEKNFAREDPMTLKLTRNLATILVAKGSHEEGDLLNQRTLELSKKVFGEEHPETLKSMQKHSQMLIRMGNYKEAEQLLRRTIELQDKIVGREHELTLYSIFGLITALCCQKNYVEAEQLCRQVLEMFERKLDREHPLSLRIINKCAVLLNKQKKHKEAEQMFRQALELAKEGDPLIPRFMANFGVAMRSQGRYKEAEYILRQALELAKEGSPLKPVNMASLGTAVRDQGRYTEAEQILRQALELAENTLSMEHKVTLVCRNQLAKCLRKMNESSEPELK